MRKTSLSGHTDRHTHGQKELLLFMDKMPIYFVLPLGVSFSRNRQLKTSNFEKNVTFPDTRTHGRMDRQTEHFFFYFQLIYIWPMSFFLFQRLLVSETQTDIQIDRQDKFVIRPVWVMPLFFSPKKNIHEIPALSNICSYIYI